MMKLMSKRMFPQRRTGTWTPNKATYFPLGLIHIQIGADPGADCEVYAIRTTPRRTGLDATCSKIFLTHQNQSEELRQTQRSTNHWQLRRRKIASLHTSKGENSKKAIGRVQWIVLRVGYTRSPHKIGDIVLVLEHRNC